MVHHKRIHYVYQDVSLVKVCDSVTVSVRDHVTFCTSGFSLNDGIFYNGTTGPFGVTDDMGNPRATGTGVCG